MTRQKQLRKVCVFVVGLMAVVAATLVIIWCFPGSMYGYGPGLSGLEAVGFLLGAGSLIASLLVFCVITFVIYLIRRGKGKYGEYRVRRGTIWQFWLPVFSILSLFGAGVCLAVAGLGPKILPLVMPEETYRKIEQERKLFVEFSLRAEQAPWTTQAFQDAVHAGDVETINKYLRYGADPKARNYFGQTALHIAVLTGNEKLVRKFLGLGVSIGARDREGETPLHDACKKRNPEILRRLIEAGADVNATSDYGTPLDIARDYQNREAIDLLTQAGATVREE